MKLYKALSKLTIIFSLVGVAQANENQQPAFVATVGPSVNESAGMTAGQNSQGQIMSMLQGGMHINVGQQNLRRCGSDCRSCCTIGAMNIAMGLASFAQGKEHGKTSGAAFNTGFETDGSGAYNPANTDPYSQLNENNPLSVDPNFRNAMKQLKQIKKDGTYNENTGVIKTNGGDFKTSDFKSRSSMAAAGLPKGAIDGGLEFAKKLSKAAEDKAKTLKLGSLTAASGYDEGAGGGGSKSLESNESSEVSYSNSSTTHNYAPINRDPSNIAGMQKNYHGEPIGVAGDSIFLMMNRRYKVKESQNSFYNDSDMALQK